MCWKIGQRGNGKLERMSWQQRLSRKYKKMGAAGNTCTREQTFPMTIRAIEGRKPGKELHNVTAADEAYGLSCTQLEKTKKKEC